jgi:protease IV
VIASFADVAASGGYYIGCPATKIMAEPTTITGSIGVWTAIPNLKGLMNNKLGITFDNAKTNENADFISVMQPLTPYQRNVLQEDIDSVYVTFANRVADGRGMTFEEVDAIGQGRIWAGTDALENGLIDTLGGLTDAIQFAAKLANLDQYEVMDLPRQKDPFEQLMDELMGKKSPEVYLKDALGTDYQYIEAIRKVRDIDGIQAALPFVIKVR